MKEVESKISELLDKFGCEKGFIISYHDAIRLSLICVDEIINAIDWHPHETPNKELGFWIDVREGLTQMQ